MEDIKKVSVDLRHCEDMQETFNEYKIEEKIKKNKYFVAIFLNG